MINPRIRLNLARLVAFVSLPAALAACSSCGDSRRGPPGAASAPASGTPPVGVTAGPFAGMTPASVDRLDRNEVCFESCRIQVECVRWTRPAAAGSPALVTRLEGCTANCKRHAEAPPTPESTGEQHLRECLKLLDCGAYEESYGKLWPTPPTGPSTAAPSSMASAPPFVTLPPPANCPAGMVPVAGGTFKMGSPDPVHHTPEHLATVASFCIDRTEVTVAEYQACARTKHCEPAPTKVFNLNGSLDHSADRSQDLFCNANRQGHAQHPLNCVDARLAEVYCAWKGGRLPTEEEWEYAARGQDGRLYPWGNDMSKDQPLGNTCGKDCKEHLAKLGPEKYPFGNGWPDTAPVGSFPANASPFGALDMVGSVEEWTLGDPCAYRADQDEARKFLPCYPNERIVRGGGGLPAMARIEHNWQSQRPALGFRCVQPGK